MLINNKTILLISPESWNSLFVSKHHYATHLGQKNNKIYFLNPPTKSKEVVSTIYENVWQVNYNGFPKGIRFYPPFLQKRFIKRVYKQLEELCGVQFDIVWSFDNSVFFDFAALPATVYKISHIVDLNQDFQIAKAASTANICFGSSQPIVNRLATYNNNSHFINHGLNSFKALTEDEKQNFSLKENGIKAFYAGNLDSSYIDWDLLYLIIKKHKAVKFYFAGKWEDVKRKRQTLEFENVHYFGVLSSNHLSLFYAEIDIFLVCYKNSVDPDQLSNPHKVMEYLGAGKVIVATWTSEYQNCTDLILMSKEADEFPILFNAAVNNLQFYNSTALLSKRIAFAKANSYENQICRIERLIQL